MTRHMILIRTTAKIVDILNIHFELITDWNSLEIKQLIRKIQKLTIYLNCIA